MTFVIVTFGCLIVFALWNIGDSLSNINIQLSKIANKTRGDR